MPERTRKMCPLLEMGTLASKETSGISADMRGACHRGACEWWDETQDRCAIHSLAKALEALTSRRAPSHPPS